MYRAISSLLVAALLVAVTVTAVAQDSAASQAQPAPDRTAVVDPSSYDQAWGITIAEPPEILRLHCPPLRGDAGVWVRKVDPSSRAAVQGIQAGDILLTANGRILASSKRLPAPNQVSELTLLRRGQVRYVSPMGPDPDNFPRDDDWLRDPTLSARAFTGGFAGAFPADHSGAVAISRAGDQINLQMTLPELGRKPIRFRGTRQQIEQQLQESTLTDDGKRRVLRALGR